jgi:hypothetical protein
MILPHRIALHHLKHSQLLLLLLLLQACLFGVGPTQ